FRGNPLSSAIWASHGPLVVTASSPNSLDRLFTCPLVYLSTGTVPSTVFESNCNQPVPVDYKKQSVATPYHLPSDHDLPEPPDGIFDDYKQAIAWFPRTEEYVILRHDLNKVVRYA